VEGIDGRHPDTVLSHRTNWRLGDGSSVCGVCGLREGVVAEAPPDTPVRVGLLGGRW